MRKILFSFLSVYTVPSPLYVADQDTLNHDYDKRTSTAQTQCCSFDYGSGSRISSKFRSHIYIHAGPVPDPGFDQNFKIHFLNSMIKMG
jgi:hypothetical protein